MAIIYLDAGHGGTETGAVSTYKGITYYEKNFNLQIVLKIRDFLKTVKPLPTIYLWRTTDHNGLRYERGQDARIKNSDVFLSVHNNAFSDTSVTGTLTLYPKDFTEGHVVSKDFASSIQTTFINYINNRGWNVINHGIDIWTNSPKPSDELGVFAGAAPIPSCLVEVAFMTSPSDMQKLTNPIFIDDAAYAIALGIVRWINVNKKSGLSDPIREPIKQPVTPPPSQEETSNNVASIIIPAILIGGAGYIIYYYLKRRK